MVVIFGVLKPEATKLLLGALRGVNTSIASVPQTLR